MKVSTVFKINLVVLLQLNKNLESCQVKQDADSSFAFPNSFVNEFVDVFVIVNSCWKSDCFPCLSFVF